MRARERSDEGVDGIDGLLLVAVAGNVLLSDCSHVLRAECVLGCGVEVARGAEALGWPCRAACLGGSGVAIAVSCV